MQAVYDFLQAVSNVVWGPIMLVMLVGTGLYLTIGLRFFSFRNWIRAYQCLWQGRKHQSEHGEVSPWNALMTALAADIGTGNIVGVATAIALGGPGALFWMWVTALVGMMTKFSEVLLSVHFREKTPAGNWVGGAMYFIKNGLGKNWTWLATAFALFGMIACFGIGAMVQANAISVNLTKACSVPGWVTALGLLFFAGIVLVGGVKRVGAVAGKLVPFMAALYVIMCLIIIFMHIDRVPSVFWWVVSDAFTPTAAQGGFVGASVMMAIRMGMARGVFSNEAGLGSAPMAHAASTAESPLVQASIGMLDVFIDTIIVCSMTGFVILVSLDPAGQPLWSSGMSGGVLTASAFQHNLPGFGEYGVTFCLTLFAFTTALGWCVYGERCVIYLFGDKAQKPFRVIYVCVVALGAVLALDLVWLLADIGNALMAFPNIIGILLLSPTLFKIVREEVKKDPRFVL
ncbi:sodium:alanine symporter family protein [Desulfovibrio porci]|uniref:alanine/glycine:cation symporter family protein n=1 Tax=Desulfovibrio porci TaxID=2605782 RepID=UPI002596AF64|nr:sodium:alanine symporter family protein [Desulfovibrio porci]MDY3808745.1 sodium:alanine symporter family protein [Desulfovibrio porci]